jgi:uncharacterized membrane protein YdjX (TVP38/TMEM64 family)
MNRYIFLFLFLCLFTITTFILFEAAGVTWEGLLKSTDSKLLLALVSVLLLGVDVVLPIPSSLLMISNGVLFGFGWGGLLSLAGGMISSVTGYLIGAKSKRLAAKFSTPEEEEKAKAFLGNYGYLAIVASRPLPVLAESVSIISGTLGLNFRKVVLHSLIGLLPISFIYSMTGAYSTSFDSAALAFVFNVGMAGLLWGYMWWQKKK